ncbi:MAG: biosynthetic-type acetolactate synthase large subunit [Planctomycetes bacterium]|nr:biosynthetic-type acetolactate synthase large subunit [Planctomycetota bacterium]
MILSRVQPLGLFSTQRSLQSRFPSVATAAKPNVSNQLVSGADIAVQCLINQGVKVMFAYPGGASMPLHQSLTRFKDQLRTVLPRHEQGCGFGAQGYSRSTGLPSVCMATSGPGATNLVTCIADAKLDSIPLIAITGQVPTRVIGTDAFQETPIVEVCRGITKHHYLVTDVNDITRVMREAFHIATTGRPGPVLIDMPKDVQQAHCVPDYDAPMNLPGYKPTRKAPPEQLAQVVAAIKRAKRPVIYAGGGIISSDAAQELRTLVKKTGIPVTMTVMGLGAFPNEDPLSLDMLGMHGSVYANMAVDQADLLVALGVRFDDRVTGKVAEFAKHGFIVHIDIDPSELNKNKEAHIPIASDVKYALTELNKIVERPTADLQPWYDQIAAWKKSDPFKYDTNFAGITSQSAISELSRLTQNRDTIISVGVGQHQMWTAQFYKFRNPRTFLSSSGLGTMGFGLPAAVGAKIAHPDKLVVDIDGDGSFQMNIQELATCFCEKVPVKVLLLNNQHLGMVVQWEDRFHQSNRAHTYLGPIDDPEATGQGDGLGPKRRFPDFVAIAKGYGCGGRSIRLKSELTEALQEMIDYDGPYVLDVEVPYQEHVLPMIPTGKTVQDLIKE